jgi:hypothetical protein
VYRGMRRGAARERGTRRAERKHRYDSGGSAHVPDQLVHAGTVPFSMTPVDCRADALSLAVSNGPCCRPAGVREGSTASRSDRRRS